MTTTSALTAEQLDENLSRLKRSGVHTLTGVGQTYALIEDRQDLVCLLSNGDLFVASGQEKHRAVMTLLSQLRRSNFKVRKERYFSVAQIRRMYQVLGPTLSPEGARGRGADVGLSRVQLEWLDLCTAAVRRQASDIHLTEYAGHGEILFRIHGDLYMVREMSAQSFREMCTALYMTMTDIADPIYRPGAIQDGRMKETFAKRCGLFGSRIASAPTAAGSRMVVRLLYDSGSEVPTPEALGYLMEQVEQISVMCRQTAGVNILSGATGSGKSTTLVSVLNQIIKGAMDGVNESLLLPGEKYVGISVVTVEDPPEYKIIGAHQMPLLADKSDEAAIRQGWLNAIKSAMRMDPDFLMIGEVRDRGSARAAFDAATTGHGVWTTLHVTDAIGIMVRLRGLEVEVDRMFDPEIVTGLVNQSLAQRLCPDCYIPWLAYKGPLNDGLRQRVEHFCDVSTVRLRGPGCATCGGAGILKRMVVAETVTPDLTFMDVFAHQNKTHAKMHWIQKMGGITKCMALIRRINEGYIDPREGERSVCALDKDLRMLGLDFGRAGSAKAQFDLTRAKDLWTPDRMRRKSNELIDEQTARRIEAQVLQAPTHVLAAA